MPGRRVLIAGAGASGLAAAVSAAESGEEVLLLEASAKPGRKILASGNGRCNLMNLGKPAYHGDSAFAREVFSRCTPEELLRFWDRLGLKLRTEEGDLVYPYSLQSSSVMEILENTLRSLPVRMLTGKRLISLKKTDSGFMGTCGDGSSYEADRIILSTGGPAQPKLGGNESAVSLLLPFGHHALPYTPALSPLETDSRSVSGLSGIRVRCEITLLKGKTPVRQEKGELLFTGDGVSGICVMQCARFVQGDGYRLEVNLVPGLFADKSAAFAELKSRRERFSAFPASSLLQGIFLPKLSYAVCKQAGFMLRGETCGELSDGNLERLLSAMEHYAIKILGVRGFDRAQTAAGGLLCGEFDPGTMESRLIPGLHVTGEALNVDGECGGYNLMFAWASGILAGRKGRKPDA